MKTESENPIQQRRIKNAEAARGLFKRHWDNDDKRRAIMAQVRNQLEGGRPFDPAELERNGTAWMTNTNFRDAEAAFNRAYYPYWKMVHDVPNKIAATVHLRTPHADKYSKAFAECFDLFLKDWGADYFVQFMLFTQDFVKFGPGYVMWHDSDSPRFKHVRTEQMILPKRAKANVDEWEICSFKRDMTASELWGKVRDKDNEKRAKAVGWNPGAVRKAIALCRDAGKSSDGDWATVQDAITSNDLACTDEWAPIEVIFQFVREFSGKICCHVFTESDTVKEYLYESRDHAETFREVIGPLFYDMGTGALIHTIKGFGVKNFYFSVLQNRMKSRLMDSATIAMAMNFMRTEETPSETPPVENYGPINIFPRGITQIPVYPQLQQGQGVIEVLAANQAENNYAYRESRQDIANTETAKQATILANLSEEIGAATSSIYLAQVGENHFSECFRRLRRKGNRDKDAVKFVKRLKERGVPEKVIFEAEVTVTTGANAGTAGAALRDMIFKELLAMSRMPGVNQRAILEAYFANKLGAQAVDKFLLPEGQDSAPLQRRMAMMENAHFGQGMPLPVDPSDAHFEHADEHLKPLEAIVGMFKQQGQLKPEAVAALQIALPHVEQHFNFLMQDETMKDAYKQVWPRFSQVQSITQGIITQLMKQQQQQRPPPSP